MPVGIFLIEHLWTNATALRSEQAFDDAVGTLQRLPFLAFIELFGILLPLAFHALYGLVLMRESEPNASRYPYGRNWLYVLQRVTGVLTLVFIGGHLYEYRLQKWLYGMSVASFYPTLAAHLSSTWHGVPVLAIAYCLGVAAAVFHFCNGLWGFAASWGVATSQRAQARIGVFAGILGVVLFALGEATVVYFATGTRLFPTGSDRVDPSANCRPQNSAEVK